MDGIVSLVEEFYSIKFTINLPEHAGKLSSFSCAIVQYYPIIYNTYYPWKVKGNYSRRLFSICILQFGELYQETE